MIENRAQPNCDLTALDDICWWARVKIKDHGSRTENVARQRKRRMKFDGGKIRNPDQRRQIVCENVIHVALISFAPNRCRLYPVRAVFSSVLFEEGQLVNAIRITF